MTDPKLQSSSGGGGLILHLDSLDSHARTVFKALGSKPRLAVLDLLRDRVLNVSEIAAALDMPLSTANLHINNLEKAGLLLTELKPGGRGVQKTCSRAYNTIVIELPQAKPQPEKVIEHSMPVGAYVACEITPTCGLVDELGVIGLFDDPASFYEANRINAQLLWFHHGFVEYRFPNRLPPNASLDNLQISLEMCSEAPLHHENWPSDITLWINNVEVGSWTSPGDFGGQRGTLTPDWWETWNSQYGLLKVWQIREDGSYVDGMKISNVSIDRLAIEKQAYLAVRFGVKANAVNVGGLNIFGRTFGNYPQDIMLRMRFT